MKPKVGFEYSDKTSYLELKLFSNASRNFSVSFTKRSRYLGGPLSLAYCTGKKIVTVRHTNPIICRRSEKS